MISVRIGIVSQRTGNGAAIAGPLQFDQFVFQTTEESISIAEIGESSGYVSTQDFNAADPW
ncbi:MAG: hypothetical protein KatS3mg111_3586 [Pirellulaceae bacterium]|nr:MAG: hypothetical protein KatS3mg111_3586 [Pirellulaceae bacterium]